MLTTLLLFAAPEDVVGRLEFEQVSASEAGLGKLHR